MASADKKFQRFLSSNAQDFIEDGSRSIAPSM